MLISQSFSVELFSQVRCIFCFTKLFFWGSKLLKWRNKHYRICKGQHAKMF